MAIGARFRCRVALAECSARWVPCARRCARSAKKVLRAGFQRRSSVFTSTPTAPIVTHDHPPDHPHSHTGSHPHRHLSGIFEMIDTSALSSSGPEREGDVPASRLASSDSPDAGGEGPPARSRRPRLIIDIVGIVFAMEWSAQTRCLFTVQRRQRNGSIRARLLPVPAPAALKILGDAPVYAGTVQELVTPTGALIATTYASLFGAIPAMSIERTATE